MARPFPTKDDLRDIIARQKELLEKPDLRLDPPWLHDPDDPVRKELREVSRKRTRMTNRLYHSVKKFEQDFDLDVVGLPR